MTEWALQDLLGVAWWTHGLTLAGEANLLLAREVMPATWEINNNKGSWAHPSIDFVFLDSTGVLTLMEMKRHVRSPRDTLEALCQVYFMADAFIACGFCESTVYTLQDAAQQDGRVSQDYQSPRERVQRFFKHPESSHGMERFVVVSRPLTSHPTGKHRRNHSVRAPSPRSNSMSRRIHSSGPSRSNVFSPWTRSPPSFRIHPCHSRYRRRSRRAVSKSPFR